MRRRESRAQANQTLANGAHELRTRRLRSVRFDGDAQLVEHHTSVRIASGRVAHAQKTIVDERQKYAAFARQYNEEYCRS